MPRLARNILAPRLRQISHLRPSRHSSSGISPHRGHSRHCLSGIHPEFVQMDPRYLPAGMRTVVFSVQTTSLKKRGRVLSCFNRGRVLIGSLYSIAIPPEIIQYFFKGLAQKIEISYAAECT